MNKPELTIIVPVYNVERYIEGCIKSILAQSFNNFELILIDDGSTDMSGKICDIYADKDRRIKVIHQRNAGVSEARNTGIELIRGKYVSFIDADDYLHPEMYNTLISILDEFHIDVAICGIARVTLDGDIISQNNGEEKKYNRDELLKALFSSPNPIGSGCWNKVLRWEDNNQCRFKKGMRIAEDMLFLYEYLKNAGSGIQVRSVFYFQNIRPDSATNSNKCVTMYEVIKGVGLIRERAKEYSEALYVLATDKYVDTCSRYLQQIKEISKKENVNVNTIKKDIRRRMYQAFKEVLKLHPVKKKILTSKDILRYVFFILKG